jgi:UDP-galactopyranose mutase
MHDYIIVGSGFAGSILAERLASALDKKVLIIEKRNHIAGNMYDYKNEDDILIHKYGPHLFRTTSDDVVHYLSQFTEWHEYQHRVLAKVNDKLVPVPFNLKSIEMLCEEDVAEILKAKLIEYFGLEKKVPVAELRKHSDAEIRWLGNFIFEKIYLNYTVKQWGEKPENLDFDTITARVPVHISFDDRYFQQPFQALPKDGYTKMFEKILDHKNIDILLNTKSKDLLEVDYESKKIRYKDDPNFNGKIIYTGPIDELFEYQFGDLPYRSLRFEIKNYNQKFFQPVGTVNYPNENDYTRITEYNHMIQSPKSRTAIMYEYPQAFDKNDPTMDSPYYPIPKEENTKLYEKYRKFASEFSNLSLIGRLAEYRYYDMHDIIVRSLEEFNSIKQLI